MPSRSMFAEAEKHGPEHFPLYKWTKVTIEDPKRRQNTSNPSRSMSMAMKSMRRSLRTRSKRTCSPRRRRLDHTLVEARHESRQQPSDPGTSSLEHGSIKLDGVFDPNRLRVTHCFACWHRGLRRGGGRSACGSEYTSSSRPFAAGRGPSGALARHGPRGSTLSAAIALPGLPSRTSSAPQGILAIAPLLKQRAAPKACLCPECGRVLNPVTMIPLRPIQAIGLQAEKIPCTSRGRG